MTYSYNHQCLLMKSHSFSDYSPQKNPRFSAFASPGGCEAVQLREVRGAGEGQRQGAVEPSVVPWDCSVIYIILYYIHILREVDYWKIPRTFYPLVN